MYSARGIILLKLIETGINNKAGVAMVKAKIMLLTALFLLAVTGAGCRPGSFLDPVVPAASQILDVNGNVIIAVSQENRIPVPLDEVSVYMRQAIVAIEDARFYQHHGIDPVGLARALYRNIRAGRVVEGGSTISQQLAKNLYLDPRRTVGRKLEEMVLTIQLERKYTKDEILELYLNQIYFGEGAYGVEAAARRYFNKSAKDLGLAESAMLAGVPRAPSLYNPSRDLEAAKTRQAAVLDRMAELGLISGEQSRQAREQYLQPAKKMAALKKAPYFIDEIIKHFEQNYPDGLELLYSGGLTIYTTMDLEMQEAAEGALTEGLAGRDPLLEGALAAVDPRTGAVRALVGGRDYSRSQFNRALAKSQPGSTFKPFLYAAAVDRGYTAGSTIVCEPVSYREPGGADYRPRDFQGDYHYRPFTLKEALYTSDNVVAVKLNHQVGPAVAASYAQRLGVESEIRPYLSLPLGTSEVTPLEMARAFGTLANKGIKAEPYYIEKVVDSTGRTLEEHRSGFEQVLDEKTAYIITDMLTAVLGPGGTAAGVAGAVGRPAAGKTGTTENFREAWFVGYTPELAASVYIGYDEKNKGVGRTGGELAAPVWARFMREALKGVPSSDFPVPGGIVRVRICPDDGLLAGEFNTRAIEAAFVRGTEPVAVCFGLGPGEFLQPEPPGVEEERGPFTRERRLPGLDRLIPREYFNLNRD